MNEKRLRKPSPGIVNRGDILERVDFSGSTNAN